MFHSAIAPFFIFLLMFLFALPFVQRRVFPVGGYTVFSAAIGLLVASVNHSLLFFLALITLGMFLDLLYGRFLKNEVAWQMKFRVFALSAPIILIGACLAI